ncbi:MAG: bifunctional DNA primase/polymerase, partial [Pseudomonadota bacterium]|nr:bifunctional DNA primase/polymerase [Pseudomonadota bacterium]
MPYTTINEILEAARQCYDLGYIPLPVDGKAPLIKGYQRYTTGELPRPSWEEVSSWFNQKHTGFGLLCGTPHEVDGVTYRMLGLDIDLEDIDACMDIMRAIPASTAIKRGRRGFTAFYLVTEEQSNSTKMAGVFDWIAKRKYTVMPPSVHPDLQGARYEWVDGATLFPVRTETFKMPAPHLLPIFTEDDYEELVEAAEPYKPTIEQQINSRDWDGTENTELYTQNWVNDRLMTHFGWLPPMLNKAGLPWDEKRGKIISVNMARDKYKPNGELKTADERTMNWHFVPYGWNGHKGGITDHGDTGGFGFTPLDVIALLTTGEDTRGGSISSDVWAIGMQIVAPEAYGMITDEALWGGIVERSLARAAEEKREAEQTALEARVEELRIEEMQQAAPTPQLTVEGELEAAPVSSDELEDVEIGHHSENAQSFEDLRGALRALDDKIGAERSAREAAQVEMAQRLA